MTKILVLDTETTGLDTPHALEVCARLCIFQEGLLHRVGGIHKTYNPLKPIEPGASEINGYTDEMVKHLPPITEFSFDCLGITPKDTLYIIGHNIRYDIDCLKNTAQGDMVGILNNAIPVCTRNLAQNYYHLGNNKLVTVASEVLGLDSSDVNSKAHAADYDVLLCLAFANHAIKEHGFDGIEALAQACTYRKKMYF